MLARPQPISPCVRASLFCRLAKTGVPYEEIVIPDDTHHFLRHANQLRVNSATAQYFERTLTTGRANAATNGKR
jgi:hypothetical protein